MSAPQLLICRAVVAAVCIFGCASSLLSARADYLIRRNTAEATVRAVHLIPFNASYLRQLAEWQPSRKVGILKQVVTLDRFDAGSWIQLGLNAELQQNNPALAERYFLTAAQVNHMYLPRWTLVNFYFRRQNDAQLFAWARRAMEIAPYDSAPVFVSLWLADPDPARIAAALPSSEKVVVQYASFLAQANHLDLAQDALNQAISLSPSRLPLTESSADALDTHSDFILDRLLQTGRGSQAMQLWHRLVAANWIPRFSTPSAVHPLTNGNFQVLFWGHGFDWLVPSVPGLVVDQFPALSNVRFTLSGTQPEACSLLQQWVPLEKGQHYRLTWVDDLDQIGRDNGITWQIYTVPNGVPAPTGLTSPDLTSVAGSPAAWDFQTPDSSDLFLLSLQYARPLGKVRIEGSLSLRSVALYPIQ
jgi:tetratricopeptide (TPR) repeat protein